MDTTLAIFMVIGIFVGIPLVIGFALVGTFILSDRRTRGVQRVEAPTSVVAQELSPQPVKIDTRK